jgi:hypothetical protein
MRSHDGFNPEASLREIRDARITRGPEFRQMSAIVDRAVGRAQGLWPDPAEREAAGFGALTAAATFAHVAKPGAEATMINLVGLFGQALVDHARGEVATERVLDRHTPSVTVVHGNGCVGGLDVHGVWRSSWPCDERCELAAAYGIEVATDG